MTMITQHQKIFGIVLALLLLTLTPVVSAGNVSLFAYWVGVNQQSITVTQGDLPQIMLVADSLAPTADIRVNLYKGAQKINTLLDIQNYTQDSLTKMLTLGTKNLLGDYTVVASVHSGSSHDFQFLKLHINPQSPSEPTGPQPDVPPPNQNHAPILKSVGDKTIEIDHPLKFTLTATDADGYLLSFSALPLQPGMTLDSTTGKFFWSPLQAGDYSITFSVSDGKAKDSESIVIHVVAGEKPAPNTLPVPDESLNAAPVLNHLPPLHVNEGDTLTYQVSATDAEKDTLTYSVYLLPAGAHFDKHTGVLTFSPNYDVVKHPQTQKTITIGFAVHDGTVSSTWKFTKITVNDLNRPPVFVEVPDMDVYTGETIGFTLLATDADAEDTLFFSIVQGPAQASIIVDQSGNHFFTWKTSPKDVGDHEIIFKVTDGFSPVFQRVIVHVKNVATLPQCSDNRDNDRDGLVDLSDPGCRSIDDNDEWNKPSSPPVDPNSPPVISSIRTQLGKEGHLMEFTISVFDKNGDIVTLTPYSANQILPDLAPLGRNAVRVVDNQDGTYTIQLKPLYSFVKHPDKSRAFTLALQADDGKARSLQQVKIIIADVNQLPQLDSLSDSRVYVGETLSFPVKASDADTEDTLHFKVQDLPVGARFTRAGFSWTPTAQQVGLHQVTFTVSDGLTTVSAPVTIKVVLRTTIPPPIEPPVEPPLKTAQCSDGKDNDGDGFVDLADPGCTSPADDDEKNNDPLPPITPPQPPQPELPPVAKLGDADFVITSVMLAPEELSGEDNYTNIFVTIRNESSVRAEDLRAVVMIPELGVVQSTKTVDLAKQKEKTVSLTLSLPDKTPAGTYLVQVLVKNDTLHTTAYRQLTIKE